jgi:hypothetical protein
LTCTSAPCLDAAIADLIGRAHNTLGSSARAASPARSTVTAPKRFWFHRLRRLRYAGYLKPPIPCVRRTSVSTGPFGPLAAQLTAFGGLQRHGEVRMPPKHYGTPAVSDERNRHCVCRMTKSTPTRPRVSRLAGSGPHGQSKRQGGTCSQIRTMTSSKTTVATTASVTNANPAASRTSSIERSMHGSGLFDIVETTYLPPSGARFGAAAKKKPQIGFHGACERRKLRAFVPFPSGVVAQGAVLQRTISGCGPDRRAVRGRWVSDRCHQFPGADS